MGACVFFNLVFPACPYFTFRTFALQADSMNENKNLQCDVSVVGAGPAGSAAAYMLGHMGYHVILIDKNEFPRVKICGEGLTHDVWRQFRRMPGTILNDFLNLPDKLALGGIRMSHNCEQYFDFLLPDAMRMYSCERTVFDHFMLRQALQFGQVQFVKGLCEEVEVDRGAIIRLKGGREIRSKVVVGADGANSRVAKSLGLFGGKTRSLHIGMRQYFTGIDNMTPNHLLEFLLPDNVMPGYFWLFPLTGGRVNVGFGMENSVMRKKSIKLKTHFDHLLKHQKGIAERFANAASLAPAQGQVIPLAHRGIKRSAGHAFLIGDAAAMVNYSTGEGIAPAIRSGRFAAEHIDKCFKTGRFDADFAKAYDQRLHDVMKSENRKLYLTQVFLSNKWVLKKVFKNLAQKKNLMEEINEKLQKEELDSVLDAPRLAMKILF